MGAIILPDTSGLAQGISQAGSALAGALQQRGQQRQAEQARVGQVSALKQGLENLGPNPSPQEFIGFIGEMASSGVDPQYLKLMSQTIQPNLKAQAGLSLIDQIAGVPQEPNLQVESGQTSLPSQQMVQPEQRSRVEELSDIQLSQLIASGNPQAKSLAEFEIDRRSTERKAFESDRKYETELAKPFLKKMTEERDALRSKDQALYLMEDAIQSGNLDFFSRDNFAKFLGKYGEGLRTLKGAQLLNAQKEFLLGNISRAGARPNMWIEQQISQMLTQVGRSKEANLGTIQALKAEHELANKKQEISDELIGYYRKELGYVPGNIDALVGESLKPFSEKIQDKLAYNLRSLYEQENASDLRRQVRKKVPKGTPLTVEMAGVFLDEYGTEDKAIKVIEKLGYTIPTPEQLESYSQ